MIKLTFSPNTLELKVDFIIELIQKFMKVRKDSISKSLIDIIIIDIFRYLVGRDDYETNQQYLGFKALFCGYIIKN